MKAFDVSWEATTILLADFDLIVAQPRPFSFVFGYHHASIIHTQRVPCSVNLRACRLSKRVLVNEAPVEQLRMPIRLHISDNRSYLY
jgi:hypothetical protein